LLRVNRTAKHKEHRAKGKDSDSSLHVFPCSLHLILFTRLSFHLITLSARASTLGGIVRPICFAAFRLMTNSNFVGCSTGRSAGLAPFKILSTYVAARRSKSGKLTPYDISPPASTVARCSYMVGRRLFTASSAIFFR